MTKEEEKDLLLKDLSARLPYGVKILHEGWNYEWDDELSTLQRVVGIDAHFIYTKVIDTHSGEEYRDDCHPIHTFDDKLYLRPMSSMTEEEKEELKDICTMGNSDPGSSYEFFGMEIFHISRYGTYFESDYTAIDWLNAHHFDYRGLIPMGLALEAPEGMYNN